MSEVNPAVVELVDYLRQTGTGKPKLDALLELGKELISKEDFLAKAAELVPSGTMAKIHHYIAGAEGNAGPSAPEAVVPEAVVEAPAVIEPPPEPVTEVPAEVPVAEETAPAEPAKEQEAHREHGRRRR